jgi:hypothetical protein
MRLKFTVHAQIRMQERGLQVDDIKKAINDPDFTKDAYEGKVLVRKELANGRTIEVVYFKDGFRNSNDYFIITAYYIEL